MKNTFLFVTRIVLSCIFMTTALQAMECRVPATRAKPITRGEQFIQAVVDKKWSNAEVYLGDPEDPVPVNYIGRDGKTALMKAVEEIKAINAIKTTVEAMTGSKKTKAIKTIQIRETQGLNVISRLIEYGADPSMRDRNGESVYDQAFAVHNPYLYSLIMRESPPRLPRTGEPLSSAQSKDSVHMLLYAIFSGDPEKMKAVLKNNPEINLDQSTATYSPLNYAAYVGSVPFVKLLLDHGANPNYQPTGGYTPFEVVSHKIAPNYVAIAGMLLEKGVSPNTVFERPAISSIINGDSHMTPLMLAASAGNVALVRLLLANGANPRALSSRGNTALDVAIFFKSILHLLPEEEDQERAKKRFDETIAVLKTAVGIKGR